MLDSGNNLRLNKMADEEVDGGEILMWSSFEGYFGRQDSKYTVLQISVKYMEHACI